jgi:hypothetical protein
MLLRAAATDVAVDLVAIFRSSVMALPISASNIAMTPSAVGDVIKRVGFSGVGFCCS